MVRNGKGKKKSLKFYPRLNILVEGKNGNKSETNYFRLINSCDKFRKSKLQIQTYQTNGQLKNAMAGTPKDKNDIAAVKDTDINAESHDVATLRSEIKTLIDQGYTVYLSNRDWETWIAEYFDGKTPESYDKKQSWYENNKNILTDEVKINEIIAHSIETCNRYNLPSGIRTYNEIDDFFRAFDTCQQVDFSMVGFLLEQYM